MSDPLVKDPRNHFQQSESQRRAFRLWTALMLLCIVSILCAWVLAATGDAEPVTVTGLAIGGMASFGAAAGLMIWQARQ